MHCFNCFNCNETLSHNYLKLAECDQFHCNKCDYPTTINSNFKQIPILKYECIIYFKELKKYYFQLFEFVNNTNVNTLNVYTFMPHEVFGKIIYKNSTTETLQSLSKDYLIKIYNTLII